MSKYIAIYEFEINGGDIPDEAVAEFLLRADKEKSDWNLWELAGLNMKLNSITVDK